ncbi:hypothetical protein D3C85_435230 [compost metagenome]
MVLQTLAQGVDLRAVGLLWHGDAGGAEQLEGLQRGQVGRRLEQHFGARIDKQLAGQVQGLLRTADDQHLAGLAGYAEGAGLFGDRLTQCRLAFAHAVLAHAGRHIRPFDLGQHRLGRQAAGEGHHFRALRRGEDFTDQGAFQAGNTFGEGHAGHRWQRQRKISQTV